MRLLLLKKPAAVMLKDTFTGANGTAITAHTPDVKPAGASWAQDIGSHTLQGNQMQPAVVNNQDNGAHINGGAANLSLSVRLTISSSQAGASTGYTHNVWFRFQDINNRWQVSIVPTTSQVIQLFECSGGTFIQRASTSYTWTPGATYTIGVIAAGANVTVSVNNANQIIFTGDSDFLTATGVGMRDTALATVGSASAWDNLEVDAL
jgi:hypothetical protein